MLFIYTYYKVLKYARLMISQKTYLKRCILYCEFLSFTFIVASEGIEP